MAELNQLIQLITIAENGTISKASEILHISQPALTRSMQKLESEWNAALFDRKKNKVTLNKTGEIAVQYAKRVIEAADTMTREVQAYERSLHTISIGSCVSHAGYAILRKFQALFHNSDTKFGVICWFHGKPPVWSFPTKVDMTVNQAGNHSLS